MQEEVFGAKAGEMTASAAVRYFDNITDDNGNKLVQSEKRAKLRELFIKLYQNPEQNKFQLEDGSIVPIVIVRREPKRAAAHYLNTADVDKEIILNAFALRCGVTCRLSRPEPKKEGELIVSDVKHLLDDVYAGDKKLAGFEKQEKLYDLFEMLYQNKTANVCQVPDGSIPIIVKRIGVNNRTANCLNASVYHEEVISAFADWAGCTYLKEKENIPEPPELQPGELTARECSKLFHRAENLDERLPKRHVSERLVDWFHHIYQDKKLNNVKLPNGTEVDLVVYRRSYAQRFLCLNTADEVAKPFVLRSINELTKADFCFDNLNLQTKNKSGLYKAIIAIAKAEHYSDKVKDKAFYKAYAERAYHELSPLGKEFSVAEWLANQGAEK